MRPIHHLRSNTYISISIFFLAILFGNVWFNYIKQANPARIFSSEYISPSVLYGCGAPLGNLDEETSDPASRASVEEMKKFWSQRTFQANCEIIKGTSKINPLGRSQLPSRYFLLVLGWFFRVVGVSWSAVGWYCAVIYGVTALFSFNLFRLVMGKYSALLFSLLFLISPYQLQFLTSYRDYSKVPFIIGSIYWMCRLFIEKMGKNKRMIHSVLSGVFLGIGVGFRSDMVICLVPFFLVLTLWPSISFRKEWVTRGVCFLLFFVGFSAVSFPIFLNQTSNSHAALMALHGLSAPFNESLDISPSVYDFGHVYEDSFLYTSIESYSQRAFGLQTNERDSDRAYQKAAWEVLRKIIFNFPSDFLTRGYASILMLSRYPWDGHREPLIVQPPPWIMFSIYSSIKNILSHSHLNGMFWIVASLLGIAAYSIPIALFTVLMFVYFFGYAMIQMSSRHNFYLEVFIWLALGFVLSNLFSCLRKKSGKFALFRRGYVSLCLFIGVFLLAYLPLFVLRTWQQKNVQHLISKYLVSPNRPLQLSYKKLKPGVIRVSSSDLEVPENKLAKNYYLRLEFDASKCKALDLEPRLSYQARTERVDLSRSLHIHFSNENSHFTAFMPIYATAWPAEVVNARFQGLDIADSDLSCLVRFEEVLDPPGDTLLYLGLELYNSWQTQPLYQQVSLSALKGLVFF
jgi:hypothetical protein